MSKRRQILVFPLILVAVAGCQESPLSPDAQVPEPGVLFAKGGIHGPPRGFVFPHPIGPPPRVPVLLPKTAGPPSFLADMIDIGAGNDYSCALRSDGAAFCWGANGSGQLGDGTLNSSVVPVAVLSPVPFDRIEVGDLHACGITAAGEAYCWGSNGLGRLGDGTSVPFSRVPVPVTGGLRFLDLDAGLAATCGIATDGNTYCWGWRFISGPAQGTSVPVAVPNSGALGFASVTVGFIHACALDAGGNPFCWGSSTLFGNGVTGPVVPTPTPAANGATFSRIEAGTFYTCALDAGGAASCWGDPNLVVSGEMGNGLKVGDLNPTPVLGGISFASIGTYDNNWWSPTTCGITSANATWCWGSNEYGQLGAPSTETCAFYWAYDCSTTPVAVGGGHAFSRIAIGVYHTCATEVDGSVWCWGRNQMGQLGDGTMADSPVPVEVQF